MINRFNRNNDMSCSDPKIRSISDSDIVGDILYQRLLFGEEMVTRKPIITIINPDYIYRRKTKIKEREKYITESVNSIVIQHLDEENYSDEINERSFVFPPKKVFEATIEVERIEKSIPKAFTLTDSLVMEEGPSFKIPPKKIFEATIVLESIGKGIPFGLKKKDI